MDDVSFASIHQSAHGIVLRPFGLPRIEQTIMVVRKMLKRGFTPVNNGLDQVWGAPWAETTETEIIARIRREFSQLTEEPSFIDICWFKAPPDMA